MPSFHHNPVDTAGRAIRSHIDADTLGTAVQRLQNHGLHILDVTPLKLTLSKPISGSSRPKRDSLVVFSRQRAVMINGELPVL